MRTTLTAVLFCSLALSAIGAHHADALLGPVISTETRHDPFASAAALRHRMARPSHWIAQVLVARPIR